MALLISSMVLCFQSGGIAPKVAVLQIAFSAF
jgi:hypothetical protein